MADEVNTGLNNSSDMASAGNLLSFLVDELVEIAKAMAHCCIQ